MAEDQPHPLHQAYQTFLLGLSSVTSLPSMLSGSLQSTLDRTSPQALREEAEKLTAKASQLRAEAATAKVALDAEKKEKKRQRILAVFGLGAASTSHNTNKSGDMLVVGPQRGRSVPELMAQVLAQRGQAAQGGPEVSLDGVKRSLGEFVAALDASPLLRQQLSEVENRRLGVSYESYAHRLQLLLSPEPVGAGGDAALEEDRLRFLDAFQGCMQGLSKPATPPSKEDADQMLLHAVAAAWGLTRTREIQPASASTGPAALPVRYNNSLGCGELALLVGGEGALVVQDVAQQQQQQQQQRGQTLPRQEDEQAEEDRLFLDMFRRRLATDTPVAADPEALATLRREVFGLDTYLVRTVVSSGGLTLMRGVFRKEQAGAMEEVNKRMAAHGLDKKLLVFMVRDEPREVVEEDLDEMELFRDQTIPPVFVICSPDTAPEIVATGTAPLVWSVSLATVALSAMSSYASGPGFLADAAQGEWGAALSTAIDTDGAALFVKSLPLIGSFLGLQAAHDAGHMLVAVPRQMRVRAPQPIPAYDLAAGHLGTRLMLRSYPPDNRALFDFSLAGPLLGGLVSLVAFVVGLQLTQAASPSELALFPKLPAWALHQSVLLGGIADFFVHGYMDTPSADAGQYVGLHPLAIAGGLQLFVNGLHLLPFGNTDGGAAVKAALGTVTYLVVWTFMALNLVIQGFFSDNIVLLEWAMALVWLYRAQPIACQDEVQPVGERRVLLLVAAQIFALLMTIPFPYQDTPTL